jgi:hypothetical protein
MAAHGLAFFFCFAMQGFLPAQGFFPAQGLALLDLYDRAAQGLAAPQGAASAAPLMAAASAPEERRVFARVLRFMVVLLGCMAWPEWRMQALVVGESDNLHGEPGNIVVAIPGCRACYNAGPFKYHFESAQCVLARHTGRTHYFVATYGPAPAEFLQLKV